LSKEKSLHNAICSQSVSYILTKKGFLTFADSFAVRLKSISSARSVPHSRYDLRLDVWELYHTEPGFGFVSKSSNTALNGKIYGRANDWVSHILVNI
jgi:hypothetical protein